MKNNSTGQNLSKNNQIENYPELINRDGKQAVSARELHAFLGSKQDFSNWIKNRISKYGLIENQDYVVFDKLIENLLEHGLGEDFRVWCNERKNVEV